MIDTAAPLGANVHDDPKRLVRWNQIAPHVGIGRSAFLERVRLKTAPQPVKVGKATFWLWGEVAAWRDELIRAGRAV